MLRFSASATRSIVAATAPARTACYSTDVVPAQIVTSIELSSQLIADTQAKFKPMSLTQALQQPLQWRESVLADGSIMYRHPTTEQVMSVKLARLTVMRAVQKRRREQAKLEEEARAAAAQFIPRKTKQQQEAEEKLIAEQVHKDLSASNTYILSPEQIAEVKKLRFVDPITYSTQNLAKLFRVKPEQIAMVSREPEDKVKQDLRELKERNQNRPRHGSRQVNNR